MALSENNSTFWQLMRASLLLAVLALSAIAQEPPSTLEAALATTDPAARLTALQKFLQAQPDVPQADTARAELTRVYAYLGEIQLGEKNVDGAIQQFKQAIAAFPKQVDDKFFDEVAARIPVAVSIRGYRTEAILLAREMEARFGAEAKRLASIGEFYLSVEAPTEALRALNAAAKLTPDDARIYRLLGAAHRVNLNLDKAAEQYTAAIKADPKDSRAYFELANLQRARGRYDVAINLYNHQLGLEPEHAPSLKGLALCHIAQGKEERANELLAQAAKITNADLTRDFYLQTQLALTYLARGKVAKARQAADAALTAEPRFSWARIAAAEVELADGKYFDSERHIIAAMKYADFPTLHFTLGKIYLAVEDFEGALDEFNKAFSYKAGKFQTRLGGAQEATAETVVELLAPERQASMFQAEPITTDVEFKLAENLTRFEGAVRGTKPSSSQLLSAIVLSQKTNKTALAEIEKSTEEFVETEGSRKAFRWLYAAERLTQSGQALETVLKLTDQALDAAESATAPDGSLRDYPNYDRDGRLSVFRARALTLRGRALVKLNRSAEAITTLEQAVETYGATPERSRAQWQLALAKESAGQTKEALDLYITAYEPPDKTSVGSDLNRSVIESLYRKVHGSLDGLSERIGKARETALAANVKPIAQVKPTPTEKTEVQPVEKPTTEATTPPEAVAEKLTAEVTETKPTAKPEPIAEPVAPTPVVLPEARLVAVAIGELASAEPIQLQLEISGNPENEAAPPSVMTALTNVDKPAEEPSAIAAPIALPEAKPVSLILATEELARAEVPLDLLPEDEDAPLPLKSVEAVASALSAEAAKSEAVPPPVVALPEAVVIPNSLLALHEESPRNAPELTLALLEVEDPTPPSSAVAKPDVTAEPPATTLEPSVTERAPVRVETPKITPRKSTELSDTRVAEIEKAISAVPVESGSLVGKKGNAVNVVEEAANGHLEGDAPVRISKMPEPVLPAGESGRVVPTTSRVSSQGNEPAAEGLPSEVERRAKEMGQSAGKLSAGAAMEVEAPERPAGQGRKGARSTEADEIDDESKPKSNVRPRRVKEGTVPLPPRK
jgi:tetratricopeptide (TPR) repeat protein